MLFFVPMTIDVPDGAGGGAVVGAVLASVFTEPSVGLSLLTAIVALALTSANSPNWFALIADVNPPEHRGTVYSLGNLVNGVGRAAGNGLVGVAFQALRAAFPPPLNFAVGLAGVPALLHPHRGHVLARLADLTGGHRQRARPARTPRRPSLAARRGLRRERRRRTVAQRPPRRQRGGQLRT